MIADQIAAKKAKKILIIDDEPQFCEDLAFLLDGPYEITLATDSRNGMKLVYEKQPDLIILDLVMPAHFAKDQEDEGIEVLKKLKQGTASKVPVLILTKMDSERRKAECLNLGAEGYLKKPPSIEELLKEIEKVEKRYNERKWPTISKISYEHSL